MGKKFVKKKPPKPRNTRPKIVYPPLTTRKWIPPYLRPKKKRKPKYVKPPGISQRLKISSLGRVWHKYKIIDGRTLLLGSYSETHKRFRPRTNGFQTPCNCMMAVAFSKFYEMKNWSTETINRILEMGNQMYLSSVQRLEDRGRTCIKLSEVYPSFFFGDERITLSIKGEKYVGKLFRDADDSPYLINVIKNFFNDKHESGIISTQDKHFAFWFSGNAFYLFDPREHDSLGYPWKGTPSYGVAIVMRFTDTDALVDVVHDNVNTRKNSMFEITPCVIARTVKVDMQPPNNVIKPHCGDFKEEFKLVKARMAPGEPEPIEEEYEEEQEIEVTELAEDEFGEQAQIEEYSPEVGQDAAAGEVVFQRMEISKSKIPAERVKAESVTYFTSLAHDKMGILRASTHQSDSRVTNLKGKQSLGNAFAALTMLRIHRSRLWIKRILDDVLKLGITIHKDSAKALEPGRELRVSTMTKKIQLEEKLFTPDVEEYFIVGALQSSSDDVLDLLPALQTFFADNETCVISGPLTLALWLEEGLFYMFDPNERDKNGLVIIKSIQIGSELQVLDYVPGMACITWYKNLKDLVEVYMHNVEKAKRRNPFIISRVVINDYVLIPDPWHHFQGLSRGKWILRGTMHQKNRVFSKEVRGTQGTAIAAIALAHSRLKHVKEWSTDDINYILKQGTEYYNQCIKNLKGNKKYRSPQLLVDELTRKFPMGRTEILMEVQDCLINGLIDAKDENDYFNLRKGLEEFFKENETCIVSVRGNSAAVWKNEEIYYYFDSHSMNEYGLANYFGYACVLRLIRIEDLAKAIEANLSPGKSNIYNINRIEIQIWEVTDAGVSPPLNNYTEINATSAILRAQYNERSSNFKTNAGKQTVPMCLACIGMIKLYQPSLWTRDIVDEILFVGDKLYTDTMIEREKKTKLPESEDIDEVYAEHCLMNYNIGVNKFSLSYGKAVVGQFDYEFDPALKKFLEAKNTGPDQEDQKEALITSDMYTVVIWKSDDIFYLFDPKPRDEGGQVYGKDEWSAKYIFPGEDEGEDDANYAEYLHRLLELGGGDYPSDSPQRKSVGSQASEGADKLAAGAKHSAHYWMEREDETGAACTMWFTKQECLIQHILENIPPNKREDVQFKILPIVVKNKPETKTIYDPDNKATRIDYYSGDWYEFKEITHGRWILRGTYDCTYILFPAHNRGKQCVAMCFAALGYVKRFAISRFKPVTVNDILKYGDRLHSATRKIRYKQIKKNKELALSEAEIEHVLNCQTYGIDDLAKSFCIGLDQINIDIVPELLVGDVNAQNFEEVFDVKRGLASYFQENTFGILACKNLNVAIWRGAKVYFMFDPQSRGPNGVQCVNGEACITRYLNLDALADVFCQNLTKEGKNMFVIHQIRVKIVPCPRELKPEEKERPEEVPKFNGYAMVMPGKRVIRGTITQDDPKFGRGKNAQCATIAVIALTMTLIHKASIWTKPIIDDIIVLGDELYTATLDTLGFDFNPWEQGLTLHLVNKDYKVGSVRANCELRTMDQRGIIEIKHPKILNLRQGIEKFFEENTHGVIETETLTVAIWEEDEEPDIIYMFDPNARGPTGISMPGGFACVLTFESAKMASDHFITNVDKSKRSGEFVITPVEIVVGNMRTKPKKPVVECAHKGLAPGLKKPSPTPAEKKRLRKMAEEERKKKEAKRLAKLGKFEYYPLPCGNAILRGSKSQTSKEYSLNARGNQDLPNCFAAFVVNRLVPVPNWHYKHIDMVLNVGNQLYMDSYITYGPKDPKLGLTNILRRIFIKDARLSLKVYKPVMCNTLTQFNLEMALLNYFQQEQFCIISAHNEHVAVFFKEGLYYMFDPHDRDIEGNKCPSGSACVMRFQLLPSLVAKFIGNVTSVLDEMDTFTVTLVTVGNIVQEGALPSPSKK